MRHFFETACAAVVLAAGMLLGGSSAKLVMALHADVTGEPTPIADIKALTEAEANERRHMRIRGVVTWLEDKSLVVQDDTAGIWLTEEFARRDGLMATDAPSFTTSLEPGMVVEVEGVTTHADLYSVMLMPRCVTVVGREPLPRAVPATHPLLFGGGADHLRVEMRGIVQGFRDVEQSPWVLLFVDAEPGEVGVLAPKASFDPDPSALVDAEVRFRGVCGACYNYRGEFLSPRIHLNGRDDMEIVTPAPSPPFDAPRIAIDALAGYAAAAGGSHRKRIEGVVTFVKPGECFYIQEANTGVRIETRSTTPLHVGDRVEVAGFPTMARRIAALKEAVVRPLAIDSAPRPLETTHDELIRREAAADGMLVTVPARLLEAQHIDGGCQLALTHGASGFVATLHGTDARPLLALQSGSELLITGIVKSDLNYDYRVRPSVERIGLLLRSPADVQVTVLPSWWSPRRLVQVIALLVAVLTAALAWAWLLRRQVAAQLTAVAREVRKRRDAVVEFEATLRERNRLAANLHDTLLQTLGGIGYQLEACEVIGSQSGQDLKEHFGTAQRMVEHAIDQLHGSVWALRSLPLRNQTFPEALKAMVGRLGEGQEVKIDLRMEGALTDVPEFVAGNLLLVIQEAIYNAIRHARPHEVRASVQADEHSQMIRVTVQDDGLGFVPGTQRGVEQGHFGLEGIRERVERLGGFLRVESAPGRGTTLHASVSRRAYDRELQGETAQNAAHPADSPVAPEWRQMMK